MLPSLPLEIVTERDIDLLVLEELVSNASFARSFISSAVPSMAAEWNFGGAWHSVTHPTLGESDLIAIATGADGLRHALLIENKVDAPPQPEQALRYRRRGEEGVTCGDWDTFSTCIMAPQKYLGGTGDARNYDSQVSYEWIHEHLCGSIGISERSSFRCQMLLQAIEQNRRGYSPKHDERVTAFWHGYWETLGGLFPDLGMQEPISKPAGSDWIEFRGGMLPPGYVVTHKLATGTVDLQTPFSSTELGAVTGALSVVLHEDMTVVATGKSCAVRLEVPQMDRFKDFGSQVEEGLVGMRQAYRLACIAPAVKNVMKGSVPA